MPSATWESARQFGDNDSGFKYLNDKYLPVPENLFETLKDYYPSVSVRDWFQDSSDTKIQGFCSSPLYKMAKHSPSSVSAGSTFVDWTNSGWKSTHGEHSDTEGWL